MIDRHIGDLIFTLRESQGGDGMWMVEMVVDENEEPSHVLDQDISHASHTYSIIVFGPNPTRRPYAAPSPTSPMSVKQVLRVDFPAAELPSPIVEPPRTSPFHRSTTKRMLVLKGATRRPGNVKTNPELRAIHRHIDDDHHTFLLQFFSDIPIKNIAISSR